ncbi:MAG TPA: hypothetical protein VEX68_04225 [Bryobacteraceae bacterium]|nr:hypothetical protein [Bryobacteraceae bacterium]
MHAIHTALWILLLVSAMLLPFLSGRYDPLATSVSACATVAAFGSLLLAPVGIAWLIYNRGYALAKSGFVVATLVVAFATLTMVSKGSAAAGAAILALWLTWLVHLWRRLCAAKMNGVKLSRAIPIALILIPLAVTATRMMIIGAVASWSHDRAIANSTEIIADIERFHQRTGAYPVAIGSLWPDYQAGIIGIERYRYEPSGGGLQPLLRASFNGSRHRGGRYVQSARRTGFFESCRRPAAALA